MTDLKQKTLRATFWAFTSVAGGRFISTIMYIALARLLSPSDYGLIASLSIILVIGSALQDVGLSDALINKTDVDNIDISTIFYFNLIMGLILFAVNWLLAPYVAAFYKEPQLVSLLRFISLNFIVGSFGLVQMAALRKNLEYSILTKANLISMIMSGLIGVTCAYKGVGVWSLAIQNVSQTTIHSILICLYRRWTPSKNIRISSIKSMLGYGLALMSANQLDSLTSSSYPMLISKYYSKTITGYYANAFSLLSQICSVTTGVFYQVAFPALSKFKDDKAALSMGYDKLMKISAFVVFPLILFLCASANSLYLAILGEKWLQAVPYFRLLCLFGITHPVFIMNRCLLAASGAGKLTLKTSVIRNSLAVMILVITIRFSISLMLVGMIITALFSTLMNMHYTRNHLNITMKTQFLQIIPTLTVATASSLLVFVLDANTGMLNPAVLFAAEIVLGIVAYLTLCRLFRLKSLTVFSDVLLGTKVIPNYFKVVWTYLFV